MSGIDTSNHAKYVDAQSNPVVRALMARLFRAVARPLAAFEPTSMLDAGCGEGHALDELGAAIPERYVGIDANATCVAYCKERYPQRSFQTSSVLELPFANEEFDVVLCMEVLEHLDKPTQAIRELARVAKKGIVLSVPFEPIFQLGNGVRGKYPSTFGNHPEHVQHWGRRSFPRWLASTGVLTDITVQTAGTWLVAKARPLR